MALTPGFEPGRHWWEVSALTTGMGGEKGIRKNIFHSGEFQKLFKKYLFTPFLYGLAPLDVLLFSPLKLVAGVVQDC